MKNLRQLAAMSLAMVGLATMAACGESEGGSAGASSGQEVVDAAVARLDELYAGTDEQPPTEGPAAERGKNVWVISCAEAAEGCALASRETQAGAEVLGWDVTVVDGQFNANNAYATGVRQAVAAGADGIILSGVDCADVKQALVEAAEEGIEAVHSQSADGCADAPDISTEVIPSSSITSPVDFGRAWGEAKATYLVSKLDGSGKILNVLLSGVSHSEVIDEGFKRGVEPCSGCEVIDVPITLADLGAGTFQKKLADALLRHSDADAVVVPYDNLIQQGAGPALAQAQMDDVILVGGEGLESNLALIREGTQTADIAYDTGWLSWAAVDTLNRAFAGEPAVPQGFGFTAVDESHNMPSSGAFASPVDFRAMYEQVWSGQ